jgi:putative PIN family toxin of toxin-antitoxin system
LDFISYWKTPVRFEIVTDQFGFDFFVCDKLLEEIRHISSKQKIRKYVGDDDIKNTFVIIDRFCKFAVIRQEAISPVRDMADLYLLSLADTVQADYIITGDKDLLILQTHHQTKIVTYNDFAKIISKQ